MPLVPDDRHEVHASLLHLQNKEILVDNWYFRSNHLVHSDCFYSML